MSILKNATDSISMGIEDFESNDPRRIISCARNLFAGILLLFKHRLVQLSPAGSDNALIKQRVRPIVVAGHIEWRGTGKTTVDVQQIRERFSDLGIAVDWDRMKKIQDYRNDVEHYFSAASHKSAKAMITDCFVVVRDFIRIELKLDPKEQFAPGIWRIFTSVAEVYEKEKEACTQKIDKVDWEFRELRKALRRLTCPECGSGLLDVECKGGRETASFTCLGCGESMEFLAAAKAAIADLYGAANHSRLKDGGEPATINCPNCSEETYLMDRNVCVLCGESASRECSICCCTIPAEELDGTGVCGYCSYMSSKD